MPHLKEKMLLSLLWINEFRRFLFLPYKTFLLYRIRFMPVQFQSNNSLKPFLVCFFCSSLYSRWIILQRKIKMPRPLWSAQPQTLKPWRTPRMMCSCEKSAQKSGLISTVSLALLIKLNLSWWTKLSGWVPPIRPPSVLLLKLFTNWRKLLLTTLKRLLTSQEAVQLTRNNSMHYINCFVLWFPESMQRCQQ